jgi:MFS family permease
VAAPVAAVETAVVEPPPPIVPEFEPAPLGSRIRLPAALGAALGAVFGVVSAGFGAVFFVDNAATVERGDDFQAAVQVEVLPFVIGMALLSAVFGAFLAVVGRRGPSVFRRDLAVVGGSGIWLGAIVGLVLGAIAGGALAGMLGLETLEEGIVAVPVAPALWWLLIGGAVLGADTAVLAHVTAVPAGLPADELANSREVRNRLVSSLTVPLIALLVLVAVIAVFASLFLLFHEAAAALAIVIAAGILLFAFLGGYRPSIRLRYTEVIAALAGVATVVLAIVMVVVVRGE